MGANDSFVDMLRDIRDTKYPEITLKHTEVLASAASADASNVSAELSAASAAANAIASANDRAYVQAGITTAQGYADAAHIDASIATTARIDTQSAANASTLKASESAASAAIAETARDSIVASANTATTKASEAAISASAAATSGFNASASAGTATTKATEAATSATSAATSASNANTSANNSASSATSASGSAATATTKAAEAATSASNATIKASEAAASATSANNSASSASTHSASASASATVATTKASEALNSANNASASATSAATSAATATTKASEALASATSAATSAATATAKADTITNMSVIASTLIAGSAASASFNSATGVLTLGVPQGSKGDKGDAFSVDAVGVTADKTLYNAQPKDFSFLDTTLGMLYFKLSNTSGDWSVGIPFGKGDKGDKGDATLWRTGTVAPDNLVGTDDDLYFNSATGAIYKRITGAYTLIGTLSIINDSATSTTSTWSSSKINTELGNKAASSHTHSAATTSIAGFMSATDKMKLDGVAAGAQVNQNAFSSIAVSGQTTVAADSVSDTLTLIAGANITITTNATNDSVTITANDSSVAWNELIGVPTTFTPTTHAHTSSEISDFSEAAQDAVGAALYDTTSINMTYDDVNNHIKADVNFGTTAGTACAGDDARLSDARTPTAHTHSEYLPKAGGTMSGAITAIRETQIAMGANDIDLAAGNLFTKTISAATTFTVSNVLGSGNANSFILELTNGGSQTITWFSGVKWAGGTAPVLTAAGVDILGFYSHDGGTTWRGMVMAKDSK